MVAPRSPPINACDELDGSPSHHVNKFHITAESNAQNITVSVIISPFTIPAPIVFATCVPVKAPIKKGAVIGYAELSDPDGNVRKIDLAAGADVAELGLWGKFVANLKYLVLGNK